MSLSTNSTTFFKFANSKAKMYFLTLLHTVLFLHNVALVFFFVMHLMCEMNISVVIKILSELRAIFSDLCQNYTYLRAKTNC